MVTLRFLRDNISKYGYGCASVCKYMHVSVSTSGDQKRTATALELELQIFLSSPIQVLGQELKSSEKTAAPLKHWLSSLSLSWTFGPCSVPKCWLCRHVLSILVSIVLRIYSEPSTLLFYSLMDGLKLNPSFLLHCLVCSSQRIDILQVCSTQNYLCPCSQVWQHKRLNRQHTPPPPRVFICSCQAGTLCLIP